MEEERLLFDEVKILANVDFGSSISDLDEVLTAMRMRLKSILSMLEDLCKPTTDDNDGTDTGDKQNTTQSDDTYQWSG